MGTYIDTTAARNWSLVSWNASSHLSARRIDLGRTVFLLIFRFPDRSGAGESKRETLRTLLRSEWPKAKVTE